ncbi:uncharacterized protein METZ01_LOCUS59740, partial [marine metagenome]
VLLWIYYESFNDYSNNISDMDCGINILLRLEICKKTFK